MEAQEKLVRCRCQHCSQSIEFEIAQAGTNATCPSCGMETLLFIPRDPKPERKVPESVMQQPKPIENHLAYIRENSCYKVLRGLINICFVLALIVIGLSIVFTWLFYLLSEGSLNLIQIIAATCLTILSSVLLIAARQCAFLLIDIADTLLHEHSKQ